MTRAHVIGMGRLGAPLAHRLEELDIEVTRWNRTPLNWRTRPVRMDRLRTNPMPCSWLCPTTPLPELAALRSDVAPGTPGSFTMLGRCPAMC